MARRRRRWRAARLRPGSRRGHLTVQRDQGRDAIGEMCLELFEVLAAFGEDDWRAALPEQLQRLAGDQLGALLIVGERAEYLLD